MSRCPHPKTWTDENTRKVYCRSCLVPVTTAGSDRGEVERQVEGEALTSEDAREFARMMGIDSD